MIDPITRAPQTSHTSFDVEFIMACDAKRGATLRPKGILADVAPTMLELLGLPIPKEMTARSLLKA